MRTLFLLSKEMKTRYTPRFLGYILSWWENEANTEEYTSYVTELRQFPSNSI
jgi:hypothetical protein